MRFLIVLLLAGFVSAAEPVKLLKGEKLDGGIIFVPVGAEVYHVPSGNLPLLEVIRAKADGRLPNPVVEQGPIRNSGAPAAGSALADLNAQRAARGLKPYIEDPQLTVAAQAAASYRAAHGISGHTTNDFSFLPPGVRSGPAGCAANSPSYGFMACCCFENWTYAGAAWVQSGGKLYCHLFVR